MTRYTLTHIPRVGIAALLSPIYWTAISFAIYWATSLLGGDGQGYLKLFAATSYVGFVAGPIWIIIAVLLGWIGWTHAWHHSVIGAIYGVAVGIAFFAFASFMSSAGGFSFDGLPFFCSVGALYAAPAAVLAWLIVYAGSVRTMQ